jgi:hypothetical protein
MAKEKPALAKQIAEPPVRSPNTDGLPHPSRDSEDSDSGARPTAPKTAGAKKAAGSPLDSRVANRNAGRRRHAGATPRPTDEPLE